MCYFSDISSKWFFLTHFNSQEKQELQKVVNEQRQQLEKGIAAVDGAAGEQLEKLNKELQKAHKDLQEAAVERERFQAQLEMLVQELEQKQVKQWRKSFSWKALHSCGICFEWWYSSAPKSL